MTAPVSGPPSAHHWTTANKILAGTTAGLQGIDWAQTLAFRGRGGTEGNPLLGAMPSEGQINTLIPLGMVATQGVGALLPSGARNVWYGGLSAIELAAIIHNLIAQHRAAISVGLRF